MASNTHPVIVVGAGPSGLAAALVLADAGIPVRIFERRMARSPHSRALAVHTRTLELLNVFPRHEPTADQYPETAAVQLAENRTTLAGGELHVGRRKFGEIVFEKVEDSLSELDGPVMVAQTELEEALESALESLGVTVDREMDVIEIEHIDEGERLTVKRNGSHEETFECKYAVLAVGTKRDLAEQAGFRFDARFRKSVSEAISKFSS
mmetsp:Transcript_19959/g.53111  ORF Transcript_19959/g.53111 Transcript_19959/m.53111 type:complete len:209 (+) Transcript_19959:382-1008(+)